MDKYFIGMLFGILSILTLKPAYYSFVEERPYNKQEELLVDWQENKGTLDIQSVFFKNGACKLSTFAVVGISNGVPKYIDYKDNDGVPENFDREEGWHLVNITIDISEELYDTVELRTRHTCNGNPTPLNNVYLEVPYGQQIRKEED